MASTTTTTSGEESIVLTIRLIRSFVYRNVKNLVVHVDRHMTVAQLKDYVRDSTCALLLLLLLIALVAYC